MNWNDTKKTYGDLVKEKMRKDLVDKDLPESGLADAIKRWIAESGADDYVSPFI